MTPELQAFVDAVVLPALLERFHEQQRQSPADACGPSALQTRAPLASTIASIDGDSARVTVANFSVDADRP